MKKKYINVDLQYSLINISYVLLQIRPVAKRTAFVGLILYKNGLFSYIIAEKNMKVGNVWSSGFKLQFKLGDFFRLNKIPHGFSIFNVELNIGCGAQVARSAGTSVKIINRSVNKFNKILLKFRSGEQYLVHARCGAVLGTCSNPDHWLKTFKSAGIKGCLVLDLM